MPFAPPVMTTTLSLSCKSIESGRVEPKDFLFFVGREIARVILDDFFHLHIAGGQQADGPVRSEHKTICAERFECNIQVRTKCFNVPLRPVRLCHQTRQFAVNVLVPRKSPNISIPTVDLACLDRWLGKMIQNEPLFREPANEVDRYRKLTRIYQDVVRKIETAQRVYA